MVPGDDDRARALSRVKWAATLLLVGTAALFGVARALDHTHWAWGYVAAFAAAATVGGLADWYAVVALFRRPLGLPIPHTAIIPRNHVRIADNLGSFIETNFLAPEAVDRKLAEVDFAAQIAEWLSDRERSAALARFVVGLLPQTLAAMDQSGLRRFMGERVRGELQRLELAPLAASLLSALQESGRHQRLLNELLAAVDKVLADPATLDALREKIRRELPALFNLYKADAYLLRKIVASTVSFIEEAKAQPDHPLRREFDRFVSGFADRLRESPDYARRLEAAKQELLARPQVSTLADRAAATLAAAAFKSASSAMITGELLPSSSVTFFMPALARMCRPTSRLPVNVILATSGCLTRTSPSTEPWPTGAVAAAGCIAVRCRKRCKRRGCWARD